MSKFSLGHLAFNLCFDEYSGFQAAALLILVTVFKNGNCNLISYAF